MQQHEYAEHLQLYRCEVCGTGFKSNQAVKNHQLIHAGEKPHQCDICGRGFRLIDGLRKHRFTHTGRWGLTFHLIP